RSANGPTRGSSRALRGERMKVMIARSASMSTEASESRGTNARLGGGDGGGDVGPWQRLVVEEGGDQRSLAAREFRAPRVPGAPDDVEGDVRRARDRRLEAAHIDDAIVLCHKDQRRPPRVANLRKVVALQRVVHPLTSGSRVREHLVVEVHLGGDGVA